MAQTNKTVKNILWHILLASLSLFSYGFGVYLTILANIGAAPWDVLSLGISNTFGILFGNASIIVSVMVLLVDIALKEPIGIAMFIDAIVVGKAVDLFNYLDLVPTPDNIFASVFMMLVGLVIMGYSQYFYMRAALGCGPRDTLLVGLRRRIKRIPIGIISVIILTVVTLIGYLLGGAVGIGTLICAFCEGPIMQFAFFTCRFDATKVTHQNIIETFGVIFKRAA